MFDSVRRRDNQPSRRFGAGALITVFVHAAIFAIVLWLSSQPIEEDLKDAEVKFFASSPQPPLPPPPPASGSTPKVEKKEKRKPRPTQLIAPKQIPQEKPAEAEPDPAPAEPVADPVGELGGEEGGVAGGQVGGSVGGALGGAVGGTGTEVMAFGEGMTRPENIRTPPEAGVCPREAREAHVEGLLLASCTVTLDGFLTSCKIIKPLPFMEEVALDVLARWRVGPVLFQGHPVLVNYKIPLRMSCR